MRRLFITASLLWLWAVAPCIALELAWESGLQLVFSGDGEVIVVSDRGVELHRPHWQVDLFVTGPGAASGEWRVVGIFEERDLVGSQAEIQEPTVGHFTATVSSRGEWRELEWTGVGRMLIPWPQIASPLLPAEYPERPVTSGESSIWLHPRELSGSFQFRPLPGGSHDCEECRRWRMAQTQPLRSSDGAVDASLWSADISWDDELALPVRVETRATVTLAPQRRQMHLQSEFRMVQVTLPGMEERRRTAEAIEGLGEILVLARENRGEAERAAWEFAQSHAEGALGYFAAALADSLEDDEDAPVPLRPAP